MAQRFRSFAEFWPFYLREHSDPRTRALHYFGTSLALVLLIGFAATGDWRLLVGAPIAGYAFAWFAHGYVEHNKPATFGHPFYSLAADYRMLFLMMAGRMEGEVAKHAGA